MSFQRPCVLSSNAKSCSSGGNITAGNSPLKRLSPNGVTTGKGTTNEMDTEPGEPNRTGGARKANPNAVLAKEKKAATQLGVIVGKKLKKSQTLSAVNGLTLGFCEKKIPFRILSGK